MTEGSNASALVYPRPRSRSDRMYEIPIIGKRYVDVPPGRLLLRTATPVGVRAELPVICVQAAGASSKAMLPLLQQLGRAFVSLSPELSESSEAERASRVIALLDVLGLSRAAVLGSSLGCGLAVELALRHPDRIAALVLVGPPVQARTRPSAEQVWQWLRSERWRVVQRWRAAREEHLEEKLARVMVPALIVRGSRDALCPQSWAARLAADAHGASLAVVPGAGHLVQTEAPLELGRIVTPFLRSPG